MTTKVHIVNFGPDNILVRPGTPGDLLSLSLVPGEGISAQVLYPQQSVDLYVHSTQQLVITET